MNSVSRNSCCCSCHHLSVLLIVLLLASINASENVNMDVQDSDRQGDSVYGLNVVVFSKNRPAQLDLLLKSMKEMLIGWKDQSVNIIFKSTSLEFEYGYERVKQLHSVFNYIHEEDNFKDVLISCIQDVDLPFTMFLVDDLIFKHPFDYKGEDMQIFESNSDILTLSLRLHPGVTMGLTSADMDNEPPHYFPPTLSTNRTWVWQKGLGDWGYPMSLNGHVFRTKELLRWLIPGFFHNPSLLEASMYRSSVLEPMAPLMMCTKDGIVVNIPANIVQNTFDNGHMQISLTDLNDQFLSGSRLSLFHLRGIRLSAGQGMLPLIFSPAKAFPIGRKLRNQQLEKIFNTSRALMYLDGAFPVVHHHHNINNNNNDDDRTLPVVMMIGVTNDTGPTCDPSALYLQHENLPFKVVWPECFNSGDRVNAVVIVDHAVTTAFPKTYRAPLLIAWLRVPIDNCSECYDAVKEDIHRYNLVYSSSDEMLQWAHLHNFTHKVNYLVDGRIRSKNLHHDTKTQCISFSPSPARLMTALRRKYDGAYDPKCKFQIVISESTSNGHIPSALLESVLSKSITLYSGPAVTNDIFFMETIFPFDSMQGFSDFLNTAKTVDLLDEFLQKNQQIAQWISNPLMLMWYNGLSAAITNTRQVPPPQPSNCSLAIDNSEAVVVVVFAQEISPHLLQRCLRSVLSQSAKPVYVYVIGVDEDQHEEIPELHEENVRLVQGKSQASWWYYMTLILEKEDEDSIVLFVDARDYLLGPEALCVLRRNFEESGAWIVWGGAISASGVPFGSFQRPFTADVYQHNYFRYSRNLDVTLPISFRVFVPLQITLDGINLLKSYETTLSNTNFVASMMEICGERSHYIKDTPFYVFNDFAESHSSEYVIFNQKLEPIALQRRPLQARVWDRPKNVTINIIKPKNENFFTYKSFITLEVEIEGIWIPEEGYATLIIDTEPPRYVTRSKFIGSFDASQMTRGFHNVTIAVHSLYKNMSSSVIFGVN